MGGGVLRRTQYENFIVSGLFEDFGFMLRYC